MAVQLVTTQSPVQEGDLYIVIRDGQPANVPAAGAISVLNGTVDPIDDDGQDGEFWINTTTWEIFGPKADGSWPATGVSLIGPAGANGADGATGATGADGADGVDGKTILSGTTDPVSQGNDGDFYLNTTSNVLFGPKLITWPATGVSLVGPTGPTGATGPTGPAGTNGANAVVTATSTSSRSINTVSKTFTFPSAITNLGWAIGQKLLVWYDDNNWMHGSITAVSSTDVTISVEYLRGSGTYSAWNLFIANGVTPFSSVTTTASRSIGLGNKTFAITGGQLPMFDVGSYVRMQYDSSNWMEGTITSLVSGTYTVNVDNFAGSGTYTPWTVSLTGKKGADAGTPFYMVVAVSDETTALTTGTAKVTFRMPTAVTLTAVRASVNTAPTGSTLIVDINEGVASILSTKLSIDATEKTSTTAATPAVISDAALADDAEITVDIDQVGSTIAGAGLKITLIGTKV